MGAAEHGPDADPSLAVHRVRNDRLDLAFLPAVGGRLLSLRVDGHELLWQNPDLFDPSARPRLRRAQWPVPDGTAGSWSNAGGSKTWVAPQRRRDAPGWTGPPDPVFDDGRWSWASRPTQVGIELSMSSESDAVTGLRMHRTFTVPRRGTSFLLRIEQENVSTVPVRWSPWEVCQVPWAVDGRGCRPRIELANRGEAPVDLGDWVGSARWRQDGSWLVLPWQHVVAKRGVADATGCVRWVGPRGETLELGFDPDDDAEYPDGGSRAEVWMQCPTTAPLSGTDGMWPRHAYAELEVLGPLVSLAPGDARAIEIRWTASAPSDMTRPTDDHPDRSNDA
ncbi:MULTISPECIES: hypothetical protein [unclassified Isoptericola]|uniref:hypothetical protein n=1 Tax=unclassified Isoptericola TaxID=2623355 RepID=UPI00365028D7